MCVPGPSGEEMPWHGPAEAPLLLHCHIPYSLKPLSLFMIITLVHNHNAFHIFIYLFHMCSRDGLSTMVHLSENNIQEQVLAFP